MRRGKETQQLKNHQTTKNPSPRFFYCCVWFIWLCFLSSFALLFFIFYSPSSSILPIFLLKSKGNQKFSYCYVADAASGIFKVLLDGINGEAYNVFDEDEGITLGGYAEFMAKLTGKNVVYQIEDDAAASRASYALLDIEKLKSIGWRPLFSVSEALEKTYQIKKSWMVSEKKAN